MASITIGAASNCTNATIATGAAPEFGPVCPHTSIKAAIDGYTFETSLADLVLLAIGRFLAYGCIYTIARVKRIWPLIAGAVASTGIVSAKIYLTKLPPGDPTNYLLYIVGVLFPFFEAWFHSSKVVYVEKRFASLQHQQLLRGYSSRADFTNLGSGSGGGGGAGDEGTAKAASMPSSTGLATGLVVGNAAGLMSLNNMSDRWSPPLSVSDAESDAFGTPDDTPVSSREASPAMGLPIGDMNATVWKSATSINGDDDITELSGMNEEEDPEDAVIASGNVAVAEVWRMATARDIKWTLELQRGSASVWSSEDSNGQEILKSEGEIAISPLVLHQLLHKDIATHPVWNPLAEIYEVIKTVDRFTDITYTVAPAMGGGMISPRDYVSIRKWLIKDGNVVIAEVGCDHPDRPPIEANIRATNGPGGYVLMAIKGRPHVTRCVWLFNADLRGWLPSFVANQTMANALIEHQEAVRNLVGGDPTV